MYVSWYSRCLKGYDPYVFSMCLELLANRFFCVVFSFVFCVHVCWHFRCLKGLDPEVSNMFAKKKIPPNQRLCEQHLARYAGGQIDPEKKISEGPLTKLSHFDPGGDFCQILAKDCFSSGLFSSAQRLVSMPRRNLLQIFSKRVLWLAFLLSVSCGPLPMFALRVNRFIRLWTQAIGRKSACILMAGPERKRKSVVDTYLDGGWGEKQLRFAVCNFQYRTMYKRDCLFSEAI